MLKKATVSFFMRKPSFKTIKNCMQAMLMTNKKTNYGQVTEYFIIQQIYKHEAQKSSKFLRNHVASSGGGDNHFFVFFVFFVKVEVKF